MPPSAPTRLAPPAACRRGVAVALGGLALAGCLATTPVAIDGAAGQAPKPATARPSGIASAGLVNDTKYLSFEVVVRGPAALATGSTAAAAPWVPLAGAMVSLRYAITQDVVPGGADVKTDANGRANFSLPPPGAPLMIRAQVGQVQLLRVYAVLNGTRATLDPATTMVSAYYDQLRVNDHAAMASIEPQRLEVLALRVGLRLEADATGVDLATAASAAKAFEAMVQADETLRNQAVAALGRTRFGDALPTPTPVPTLL